MKSDLFKLATSETSNPTSELLKSINSNSHITSYCSSEKIAQLNLSEHAQALFKYFLFLCDDEDVKSQLTKLENDLKDRAKKLDLLDINNLISSKNLKGKKLLSSYLNEWAQTNGFSSMVTFNFVDTVYFSKCLKQGSLFKDRILGGKKHGEWTHFIQWYCIGKKHEVKPFSSFTPVEILKWLGRQKNTEAWNMIFEGFRIDKNTGSLHKLESNFCSVSFFNYYLLDGEGREKFPVLHQLIKLRSDKRAEKRKAIKCNSSVNY